MPDYIERNALVKFISDTRQHLSKDSPDFFTRDSMLLNFEQYVRMQPAADVTPVKHGKWEISGLFTHVFKCSICGDSCCDEMHFCPNCGAEMWEGSS